MHYLIAVTLLWAFSFSLIGEYLSGQVDNDFAVLSRVALAALLFLPLLRLRGIAWPLALGLIGVGALQFGVTYLCLYRSFAYLSVPEVLLFTITTPLYVTLLDDALYRRFAPVALLAAVLAVFGAGLIRYDGIDGAFWGGFLLLQVANAAFAAGQVGYKHLLQRYPLDVPPYRVFFLFFLGGLLVATPAFLLFGDPTLLPQTSLQWGVVVWLGVMASGVGLYLWNQGARRVDGGTLAVMNNMLIPAGLLVNLTLWGADTEWQRLAAGGAVLIASLWLNARFSRYAVIGK
ncbi:hypothetical protein CKO15_10980 [Halorhodospira abdelmalekii]|uniref:EamA family transporter n=1 Tax=Halorhodospira abdelmalekii TaxID=421629 RepID=UPI00190771EE|nr:EamA family transporter [Halorhodospira abdelmalekii]MBK1735791.1 hypothetical protein [Halorhodospira abdelmalekii]